MNWDTLPVILSTIGQLPTTAIIAITCVLGGVGIGIGMSFRDIPKYIYKTVVAILNFILILKGKEQIDISSKRNENNNGATKILKIIEGGKSEKKENHHEDGHAT